MLKYNEGKACDAILRELERRTGLKRANVWSPEEKREGPPVELAFSLGKTFYVMEHTGIEPFEGHMQLEAQAEQHFGPIKKALQGALPPEVIELHIPLKAMLALKNRDLERVQAALIDWVRATAPTLPIRRYSDYIGSVGPEAVEGVPFRVRLFRFQTAAQPRFQIVHVLDGDHEQERLSRVARACEKKLPKLAVWKKEKEARTVLVLEDNDIQLTNPAVVTEVFLKAIEARSDVPDETYMVATCLDPWYAWPIRVGGRSYFDLAKHGAHGWQIAEADLDAITRR